MLRYVIAMLGMVERHNLATERRLMMTQGSGAAWYFDLRFPKVIAGQRKVSSGTDNEVGSPARWCEAELKVARGLL